MRASLSVEAVGYEGEGDPFEAAMTAVYSEKVLTEDDVVTFAVGVNDGSVGGDDSGVSDRNRAEFIDEPKEAPIVFYTREELEAIADKEGIPGLRSIGDRLDVKATSITVLMDKILTQQDLERSKPVLTARK